MAAATTSSSSASTLRGSSLLLSGRFIAIFAQLLIQVIIVRSLSRTDFGAFAYGLAAANLATVVVSLGMEQTMSRFAAVYDDRGQFRRLAGALICYLLVVATLGSTLVLIAGLNPGGALAHLSSDRQTVALLGILALLGPLQALDTLGTTLFAVYARPRAIFLRRYVLTPVLRIGAVLLTVWTGRGVVFLAWAYVVVTLIGVVVYLPPLLMMLRQRKVLGSGRPELPVRELARFTAGAVSADLLAIMLFASDAIIVGIISGPEGVALLQSVQPLANGNLVVFYAAIPLFIPAASRLFSAGDHRGAQELYVTASLWAVVFTFPIAAMTIACAPTVVEAFFGQRYAAAGPILALLAAGQYILAVFGLSTLLLKAHGSLKALAVANIGVAVANCVGNVFAVQWWGPVGAAAGTAVCTALLAVAKSWILKRELGIRLLEGAFLKAVSTVLVAGSAIGLLVWWWRPPLVVDVVLVTMVWGGVIAFLKRELDVPAVFPKLGQVPLIGKLVTHS